MSTPNSPWARLERALGVTFRDPCLLQEALTHRSYAHEHPEEAVVTNERLEFLGDAIFQFLVADALFRHFPDAPEGRLTALRAALVSTESFAELGEELDLAQDVRSSRGEATLGGRGRASILAGCVEAIVAAVYHDIGLDAARRLVERLLAQRLERTLNEDVGVNVKGRLQEVIQAERGVTPRYRVVDRSGPVHAERFAIEVVAGDAVLGRGEGVGKREAEQSAARAALEELGLADRDQEVRSNPEQTRAERSHPARGEEGQP
ncbi:MAG: Ribonuclease III [uncultured Chloroflexi bacterium]|uniref:Ribonuclease 3 n=1 Tax=uncultured Chloroflexota bacterium TaxID=166587 RepID=A0A6J4H6H6_9CHLR|nr:MAG: Ribonuclease III [uncultured Chloroflexota bacterium]